MLPLPGFDDTTTADGSPIRGFVVAMPGPWMASGTKFRGSGMRYDSGLEGTGDGAPDDPRNEPS